MLEILFSWLSPFRLIGIWIDSIAFSLVDNIYDLIYAFASATFFEESMILTIMNNTYIAISIFALFRIALILVNAMINPDKLSDKENGIGSVLRNLVVMFVLLIFTPLLFREANYIQSKVVEGNYIQKIFLPDNAKSENPGTEMKKIAMGALVHPDDVFATYDSTTGLYTPKDICTGKCETAVSDYNTMMQSDAKGMFSVFTKHIGRTEKVDEDGDGEKETVYIYTYMFIVTFVVGCFITYILFTFGLDIAIRAVELAVLEMIAPLFIVTYIDPKSAKTGPFHKWLTTVGKTYASLFIKLAILSLMIMFISLIDQIKVSNNVGFIGKLVILLAILIFAKKAPKWIGDMIGVDGESSGLGGLGKKIGSAALVGGALTKAGHAAAGMGVGAIRNAHGYRKAKKAGLSSEKERAHNRLASNYKTNRDSDGRIKSATKALGQTYFSKDGIRKNLSNAAKTSAAGGLGFMEGVSSGAKLGWDANDLKDVNAKVKADAKTKFDKYAPDYTSIPSRVGDTLAGLHKKGVESVIGNPFDIEKRKEDAEKMQKAKDRYGKVTTNADGSRNKLVNPVNSLETNEMVEKINKSHSTQYDASSIEGISKALVQANIDAGNIKGDNISIDNKGISVNGTVIPAATFCEQNGIYNPYGKKELEVVAKESAYTRASEYADNKQKISDANKDASTANAQMLSLLENIKTSISGMGDGVEEQFGKVTASLNKQLLASTQLNKALSSGDASPDEISALRDAVSKANSDVNIEVEAAKTAGIDVGLLDSYVAATSARTDALSTISILNAKNTEIEEEVRRSIKEAATYKEEYGESYKVDSNFTTKDITTGATYTFLEDPTKSEYVASLMNKATEKAKDDASKLKPKSDEKK